MPVLRRIPTWLAVLALAALAAPAGAAEADPYLPDDTESVQVINVKEILGSPLFKKEDLEQARGALQGIPEVGKHLTDLGFDPLSDLDRIVIASSGKSPDKGLVIIHGRFDVKKWEAKADEAAKEHGDIFKITKEGNYTVYQITAPNVNELHVAVVNKTTVVAAPAKDLVVEALDKGAGKKKGALQSKDFAALLAKVDSQQALWVAALGSTLAQGGLGGGDAAAKEVLAKAESVTGGVKIAKDIKADFSIVAKDPDAAKDIARFIEQGLDNVKQLLGFLAAGNKQIAPVAEVLNVIKVTPKDKVVSIKGEVTAEFIEKALKKDQ